MPFPLAVAEFFEAVTGFGGGDALVGGAAVGAQEEVEGVEGGFVGFALALDELVPFGGVEDLVEFEGHYCGELGGDCSRRSGEVRRERGDVVHLVFIFSVRYNRLQRGSLYDRTTERESSFCLPHFVPWLGRGRRLPALVGTGTAVI